MLQSLLFDAFIILILFLLALLGFQRGGFREICSAAGLLFGVAMVSEWAPIWGNWFAKLLDLDQGASTFMVAVLVLVITTMVCGYGATAAFVYKPGPGGRMYGALLGALVGALFVGYLINYVKIYLRDGTYPTVVADSYLGRLFSSGIDWVLLGIAAIIVLATAFGMLVREQAPDDYMQSYRPSVPDSGQANVGDPAIRQRPVAIAPDPVTDKIEPAPAATSSKVQTPSPPATAPMRIREVRHWEEPAGPNAGFGSGWSQTWPASSGGTPSRISPEQPETLRRSQPRPNAGRPSHSPELPPSKPVKTADVLREWLENEGESTPESVPRPKGDE